MTQVVLAVVLGSLAAVGTYLVLRQDLLRVVWGVSILGQTANVYLVTMGGLSGTVPVLTHGSDHAGSAAVTDPLVQALVLTAIVIGFGTTAFALGLTYRVYQEHGTLDLQDLGGPLDPGQASATGAQEDVAVGSGIVEEASDDDAPGETEPGDPADGDSDVGGTDAFTGEGAGGPSSDEPGTAGGVQDD